MFGIIRRIRGWLERKFLHSLGILKNGFLVINQDQGTSPTLQKCTLEVDRYIGRVLPIFKVKKHSFFSLIEVITQPIQASKIAFMEELEKTPVTALMQAEGYLTSSTKQRIGRAKTKTIEETEKRCQEFDGQVLLTLIKNDRNAFRQMLLGQLGKTAADTFANVVKKHLAELVLRTREECLQEGLIDDKGKTGLDQLAMPIGTRFFQRKGKMTLFVIEQPPMKRTIQTIAQAGSPVVRYELSFPFVIFFVVLRGQKFDKLYVFFRTEPLRAIEDALLCPALSNVFPDFRVCFAGSATAEYSVETVEATVGNFWGGRFKLSDANSYLNQISLKEWEGCSQKDSLFGLSYQWRAAQKTVASMMESIGSEFHTDEKKKNAGGVSLSTLEKCTDKLAALMTKEIQEACFFLIPKWSIEEAILKDVAVQFKKMVEDICLLLRTELEEGIEGVLSERNFKRAFQKAIERTVEIMKTANDNSVVVAHQALLTLIKEEISDSRPH